MVSENCRTVCTQKDYFSESVQLPGLISSFLALCLRVFQLQETPVHGDARNPCLLPGRGFRKWHMREAPLHETNIQCLIKGQIHVDDCRCQKRAPIAYMVMLNEIGKLGILLQLGQDPVVDEQLKFLWGQLSHSSGTLCLCFPK